MAFCSRCGVSIEGRFCSACGYDNQPQEKVQNVDDTVSQLYSLRGGISLVATQIDNTQKEEKQGQKTIEVKEGQIKHIRDRISNDKLSIIAKHEKINAINVSESKSALEELEAKKQEKQAEEEKEKATLKKTKPILYILGIPLVGVGGLLAGAGALAIVADVLFFIVGIILRIFGVRLAPDNVEDALLIWQLVGGIGGIIVGAIIGFIGMFITSMANETNFASQYAKLDEEINEIKAQLEISERSKVEIVDLEKEIVELTEENEGNKNELMAYKKEHLAEIDYYKLCTNETYNALVKEYSSLLDVRDWENLDLIIYYLETRRAISVREALQLADRQHQTDAIIQTFKVATEQIKETINLNSQRLESTMLKCSKVIATQLDDIGGKLNSIDVAQNIMNNHLRNISSEMAVSNALKAKANVTSEQMMSDIRQMRVYADNAAINARNS